MSDEGEGDTGGEDALWICLNIMAYICYDAS